MRHLARYFALVVCLAVTSSSAHAEVESEEIVVAKKKKKKKRKATKKRHKKKKAKLRETALADRSEPGVTDDEMSLRANRQRTRRDPRDWNLAIGPYVWASSVQADVSLGSTNVGAGVDFLDMTRHTKFGAEAITELRYRRFSLTGDILYGVVGVNGGTTVGPIMVTVDGEASSLLFDGNAGYRLLGDNESLLSLEARAGVRYQRTTVAAAVGIAGSPMAIPEQVDAGSDALVGGRVFVRPSSRFAVSGNVDIGVFGTSTRTWSAAADASMHIGSRMLLSLGWRTLVMDRANVKMTMTGPRFALQFLF